MRCCVLLFLVSVSSMELYASGVRFLAIYNSKPTSIDDAIERCLASEVVRDKDKAGTEVDVLICRLYSGKSAWIDNVYISHPEVRPVTRKGFLSNAVSDYQYYAEVTKSKGCISARIMSNGKFASHRAGIGCENHGGIFYLGQPCSIDLIQAQTKPPWEYVVPIGQSFDLYETSELILFASCGNYVQGVFDRNSLQLPEFLMGADLSIYVAKSREMFRAERYPEGIWIESTSKEDPAYSLVWNVQMQEQFYRRASEPVGKR